MKVTLEVELQPFLTPNFVLQACSPTARQEGMKEPQSYPLSALDSYTLSNLCDDFRDEVFRKAGKEQPPSAG